MEKKKAKDKEKKIERRIKDIEERYSIIIFLAIVVLIVNVFVMLVIVMNNTTHNMASNLVIENHKLKQSIGNSSDIVKLCNQYQEFATLSYYSDKVSFHEELNLK